MPRTDSKATPMTWWGGLGLYYKDQWRVTLLAIVIYSVVFVVPAIYTTAPFALSRAVTTGKFTSLSCGGKGYNYTYSYTVQGALYSGESGWGNWDGNEGPCSSSRVGQPAFVTYDPAHPERSIGGTIAGRFKPDLVILGLLSVAMTFVFVPVSYATARRKGWTPRELNGPPPLSRQSRRALERRERKANKPP
jgi:hypothetical protein